MESYNKFYKICELKVKQAESSQGIFNEHFTEDYCNWATIIAE